MSTEKTNQFGEALLFILGEFAVADDEHLEHGCMEVYGEDEQGREGSCEVTINDLAQAAIDEIKHLREQLAKANERVIELETVKEALMSRYGDNWYDGFMTAKDLGFDKYSESEILQMSEAYEDEKLKSSTRSDGDVIVNKFAIEKKIEALQSLLKHETSIFRLHSASKRSGVFCVDINREIEALRLRKEQGNG